MSESEKQRDARTLLEAKYGKFSPSFKKELAVYAETLKAKDACDCFSMGVHNCPVHKLDTQVESVPWRLYRPGQFSE